MGAAAEETATATDEVDEAEAKRQRKLAKRKAKEALEQAEAAPVVEEAVETDEAEAKRQRKAAKKAAKLAAAAAAAEEQEAEKAQPETPPKSASKRTAEAESGDEEVPKKKKVKKVPEPDTEVKPADGEAKSNAEETKQGDRNNDLTVFIRGLPWSVTEDILRKDFAECGEIEKLNMPKNEEGKSKGIAFVKYLAQEGFDAALKFDNTEYGGRNIFVSKAGEGGKGKGKDGKGKDGKGKGKSERDNELTVFVRGLPFSVEEEALKKDFAECGAIERLNLPMNEEGKPKGIAFVKFETQEGVDAALKFDNTEYGGRTINVSKAGEGGKGKGKDAKGKGKKGKDGKGKSKGKGKKGAKNAAQTGAMVESTGERKTFADSDDDDE